MAPGKNPAVMLLERLGRLKGGKARAKKTTAGERAASARKAAKAWWAVKRRKFDSLTYHT